MESGPEASSSNSSISTRKTWKYDVFLSFMGKDTLKGFTNYLFQALNGRGFRVFSDDKEREGEVISEELLQAIEASRFAIIVLSKNYASSSWCLDELSHILYSRDNMCEQVLPIFYNVVPSDVPYETGSFAEAFSKHKDTFQQDQLKVQIWRDSLTKVANLSGFDSSQYWYESELIENVVEHLWEQFHSELPPLSVSDALIGIDWRVVEMLPLLQLGGFPFIGGTTILGSRELCYIFVCGLSASNLLYMLPVLAHWFKNMIEYSSWVHASYMPVAN